MSGSNPADEMLDLLAVMRASFLVYRDGHWKVKGNDYYGDHLLLQRIYEETEKQIDQVGERIVGLWGPEALDSREQATLVDKYYRKLSLGDPMQSALAAAELVHEKLFDTYEALKKRGEITLGLDDLLMAISSEKETHLYLLQQALSEKPGPVKMRGLKTKLLK